MARKLCKLSSGVTAGIIVVVVLLTGSQVRPAHAYYNLPLLYWPLDDEYRHILAYPNTEWTWAYLGLNPGNECPPYYSRSFEESWDYWRDPSIPLEQDWYQASRGHQKVACYSRDGDVIDHRGTDITTPPLAPVYAVANGKEHFIPIKGQSAEPIKKGEWVLKDESPKS